MNLPRKAHILSAALTAVIVAPVARADSVEQAQAYLLRAKKELEHRDTQQNALNDINKAIELNPKKGEYYLVKSNILEDMEDDEQALAFAEKACQMMPNDAWSLRAKASVLSHLKRTDEAVKVIDQAIKLTPHPHFYQVKTRALMQAGRWAEASTAADRAVNADPHNDAIRMDRMRAFMHLGKYEAVAADATICLGRTPQRARDILQLRAQAYAGAKQYQKAIDDYKAILRQLPNDRTAHAELLKLYTTVGDKAAAKKEQQFLSKFDEDLVPF